MRPHSAQEPDDFSPATCDDGRPTPRRPHPIRRPAVTSRVFDLPDRLAAKAEPELIADDERRFAAIAAAVRTQLAELEGRLDEARLRSGENNQEVLERDLEVHELSSRIRLLRRFG